MGKYYVFEDDFNLCLLQLCGMSVMYLLGDAQVKTTWLHGDAAGFSFLLFSANGCDVCDVYN